MNKLEEIIDARNQVRQHPYSFAIEEIGERDNDAIDFLLRAVTQLVNIVCYIELDEGDAIIYAPEALIRNMKTLDPDVRELVENN